MSDTGYAMYPRWLKGELPPTQLAVYVALTFYTDGQDRCWPSVSSLAKDTCQHENTVRRALHALSDRGLVEWDQRFDSGGDQTTNMYRVRANKPRGFKPRKGGLQKTTPPSRKTTTPPAEKDHPPTREVDDQEPINKTNELAFANAQAIAQNEPKSASKGDFDAFWNVAVRKTGKGAAKNKFTVALTKITVHELMAAWVAANRVWVDWSDRSLIPHPATWLNQERWGDEPPEPQLSQAAIKVRERRDTDQMVADYHEATEGMSLVERAQARIAAKQQQEIGK